MLSSTCNAACGNLAAELPAAVLDQPLTIDINPPSPVQPASARLDLPTLSVRAAIID
jgi:hypothetical protein